MKVMKFGGTSVGSVNSILTIKQIVSSVEEPVVKDIEQKVDGSTF